MNNQPASDPDQPWQQPREPADRSTADPVPSWSAPTSAEPVPAEPVPAEPVSAAPVPAEPATEPAATVSVPPAAPTFRPGYAPLPRPAGAQPLPPTSAFPQQPYSASDGGRGGYPPQPEPGQPWPPPAQPSPYSPQGYGQQGYPPPPGQSYGTAPDYAPQPTQGYGAQQGGYGPPPGYGPPQPGYAQPPRPPKRSRVPLVAVLLAVTLLLCGGVVSGGVLLFNKAKDRAEEALKPITDPVFPTGIPDLPGLPTDLPDLPTDAPGLPDPAGTAKTITVVYQVTGDGPASIIYTVKLGDSPERVENATLPWTHEMTVTGAALVSVTAIRTGVDTGSISCSATVDGQQVAQRTREGTFATASCIKMVF